MKTAQGVSRTYRRGHSFEPLVRICTMIPAQRGHCTKRA